MSRSKSGLESVLYRDAHNRCRYADTLCRIYSVKLLRPVVLRLTKRLEGGPFFSRTLRDILLRYHAVEVGPYSYGGCLVPGYLPRGSRVGNYSSVSSYMRVYRRNHPDNRISQHPFFYNRHLGLLSRDSIVDIEANPLNIGHDVWIGHQTVITPNCRVIGDGAIIGAGAVVSRDVEPFTVVAGNPARVLRKRFTEDVEIAVRASQWWQLPLSRLVRHLPAFLEPANLLSLSRLAADNPEAAELTEPSAASASAPNCFREDTLPAQWESPNTFVRRKDHET